MPTSHVKYHYIDDEAALVRMVTACSAHDVITVDTEFARSHTYYPEVGLVQIYDGENCYLIDPVAIGTLKPLAPLLEDSSVLKVFHACSEDMEVFQYAVGALPSPAFDTQIAAAAVGVGFSISYQNLVGHYLGIDVPKEETRSDWLQRPLTQSQLDYAALDVIYLLMVFNKQQVELTRLQRLDWVAEECSLLTSDIAIIVDPDQCYLRVKSAGRMSKAELNVLRILCAWREREARKQNVPRNRVIEEKALVALARAGAKDRDELRLAGLSERQLRKFGDD
ncbi:MAG: ribonuclease D, partial [Pseudomonadales bacterium]